MGENGNVSQTAPNKKEAFNMEILYENFLSLFVGDGWKYVVMWAIGALLIFLAIKKDMEPTLLLPLGFGTIMVNLPLSGAIARPHAQNVRQASNTAF